MMRSSSFDVDENNRGTRTTRSRKQQQHQQHQFKTGHASTSGGRRCRGGSFDEESSASNNSVQSVWKAVQDARPILPKAAFFLGDLRDGLPMLNMEAAFLISTKSFTEKQVGTLFLVFGLSQFLCMAPAGYFLDYSNHKIHYVIMAAVLCSGLTVLTALSAKEEGANMVGMIILKIIQGGVTAIIPPGFNGITLGIVGSTGFTHQVSRNRMMNHVGTALVVAIGSLVAYFLYPKIGALFLVSPVAAVGVCYNLRRIVPTHVDRDAARGLILTSRTMTEYELADDVAIAKQQAAACAGDASTNNASLIDDRMSMASSSVMSSSLLSQSLAAGLKTAGENDKCASSSRQTNNLQSAPYYPFPSDGSNGGPTPPPSETAAPRRGGYNSQNNGSNNRIHNNHNSYKPPTDLITDTGLSPPSTDAGDGNNDNKSRSSSSVGARAPYYPPPPAASAAKRTFNRVPSIDESSGLDGSAGPGPDSSRPRHQPPKLPPRPQPSCDGTTVTDGYESSDTGENNQTSQSSRVSYSSIPSFNFGLMRMSNSSSLNGTDDVVKEDTSGGEVRNGGGGGDEAGPSAASKKNPPSATRGPMPPHHHHHPATLRARTPLAVLLNPPLIVFCCIIFFFYLANSAVLPLVMQSLALRDPQAGILLSGLCILIAQACMACFAKLCGDWSPIWGRKNLMLVGLASLTLRCFLLTFLVSAEYTIETERGSHALKALILSTQFLDSVGAGIIGTLQILVTSDLSGGTGRFSLLLGVTTASMCLGATISSYVGQVMAYEYGYPVAFTALGIMSLIPFAMYIFLMPETLPDYARPQPKKRQRRLRELLKRLNEHRRKILQSKNNPFRRRKKEEKPTKGKGTSEEVNKEHREEGAFSGNTTSSTPLAARDHVELV